MGIHKGTKLTQNPKDTSIRVRVDKQTIEKLNYLTRKENTTKSEVIRKGIEIQFDQIEK